MFDTTSLSSRRIFLSSAIPFIFESPHLNFMSSAERLIQKLERLSKRVSSVRAQPKVEPRSRIPKRREHEKPKKKTEIQEYLDSKFSEFLEERELKQAKPQKRSSSIPSRRVLPPRRATVPTAIKEAAKKPVAPKTKITVDDVRRRVKQVTAKVEPVVAAARPKIMAKKAPERAEKWKCLQSSSSDDEIDRIVKNRRPVDAKPKVSTAKELLARLDISDSSSDEVILEEIKRRNAARKLETEALKKKSPAKEAFKIGDRTYTLDSSSDSEVLPDAVAKKTNPVLLGAKKIKISSSSSDDALLQAIGRKTSPVRVSPKKPVVSSSSSDDTGLLQAVAKRTSPVRVSPKKPVVSSSSSDDDVLLQALGRKTSPVRVSPKKPVVSSSSSDDHGLLPAVAKRTSPVRVSPKREVISSSSSDDVLLAAIGKKPIAPHVSPKRVVVSSSSSDEVVPPVKKPSPVRVLSGRAVISSSSSSDDILLKAIPKRQSPVRASPKMTVVSSSSSEDLKVPTSTRVLSPIRVSPKRPIMSSSSSEDLLLSAIGMKPIPKVSPKNQGIATREGVAKKPAPVIMSGSSESDDAILPTTKPSPKGYKIQKLMAESHISDNSSSDNIRVIVPPKRVMTPKDKRNEVRTALADASSDSIGEPIRTPSKKSPVRSSSPLAIGGAMAVNYTASKAPESDSSSTGRAAHSTPKAKPSFGISSEAKDVLASGSPKSRRSEIMRKYGISDSSDNEAPVAAEPKQEPKHFSSASTDSDDFRPKDEAELKKKLAEVGMGHFSSSESESDAPKPKAVASPKEKQPASPLDNAAVTSKQSAASRRSEILKSLGLTVTSSDLESASEDLDVDIKIEHTTRLSGRESPVSPEKKKFIASIKTSSSEDHINVSTSLPSTVKDAEVKESREDVLARMNEEHVISGSDEELFSLTQPSPRSSLTPSPMRSRNNTDSEDASDANDGADKGNGLQVIDDITPKEILISSLSNSGELRSAIQAAKLQMEEEEEEFLEPASASEGDLEKPMSTESDDEVIMIDANQAVGEGSDDGSEHETNLPLGQDAVVMVDDEFVKAVPTIRMPTPRPSCGNLLEDEEDNAHGESEGSDEEVVKKAPVKQRPIPKPMKPLGLQLKPIPKIPNRKIPPIPHSPTQSNQTEKAEPEIEKDSEQQEATLDQVQHDEFAMTPVEDEAKVNDLKAFLEQGQVSNASEEEEGDLLGLQIKYDDSDLDRAIETHEPNIEDDPMVKELGASRGQQESSETSSSESLSSNDAPKQPIADQGHDGAEEDLDQDELPVQNQTSSMLQSSDEEKDGQIVGQEAVVSIGSIDELNSSDDLTAEKAPNRGDAVYEEEEDMHAQAHLASEDEEEESETAFDAVPDEQGQEQGNSGMQHEEESTLEIPQVEEDSHDVLLDHEEEENHDVLVDHEEEGHDVFADHEEENHEVLVDHEEENHDVFADHEEENHEVLVDHEEENHDVFVDHEDEENHDVLVGHEEEESHDVLVLHEEEDMGAMEISLPEEDVDEKDQDIIADVPQQNDHEEDGIEESLDITHPENDNAGSLLNEEESGIHMESPAEPVDAVVDDAEVPFASDRFEDEDTQEDVAADIVAEEESLLESHDQDLEDHNAAKDMAPEEESDSDLNDDEVVARAHDLLDNLGISISSSDSDGDVPKAVEIVNNLNLSSTSDTADHTNENVTVEQTGDDLDSSLAAEMDNSHYATKVHSALVEDSQQDALTISHDEEESEVHVDGLDDEDLQDAHVSDGELLDVETKEEESDQGLDLYEQNSGQPSQDELLPSDDE